MAKYVGRARSGSMVIFVAEEAASNDVEVERWQNEKIEIARYPVYAVLILSVSKDKAGNSHFVRVYSTS